MNDRKQTVVQLGGNILRIVFLALILTMGCSFVFMIQDTPSVPSQKHIAQMFYRPSVTGISQADYKAHIDTIKILGYDTVQIGINKDAIVFTAPGTFSLLEFSSSDFSELIQYAIDQGLEPVVQTHLASKIYAMVAPLLGTHPSLLDSTTGKTHDPYYQFDASTDMLAGIYKPIIDWIIASYPLSHPCRYIVIGGDEFDTDSMQTFGAAQGVDASEAWAKTINDIVDYARGFNNLKVVLWGDKLLSPELGSSSHGITGWTPDMRFLNAAWKWNSLNAERNPTFPTEAKDSVYTTRKTINHINHKEDIIIGDWHYRDGRAIETSPTLWEYPSVDYFQSMGFDSVWAVAFHTEMDEVNQFLNARMFAKYSEVKKVGGQVASVWFTYHPPYAFHFAEQVILEDTARLIDNPEGIRTLSQFSMTNYANSGWIDVLQNNPASYTIATGGNESIPLVRDAYLYLEVEAGAKGVGLLCQNENTVLNASDFDEEVSISTRLASGMVNDARMRTFLVADKNNFLAGNWLMIQTLETTAGLSFMIVQNGTTYVNQAVSGLSLSDGDTLNLSVQNDIVSTFEFVDADLGATYDILALSGWNGSITSCKLQFTDGAYTMLELLSPNGTAASIKIDRIAVERKHP